MIPRYLISLYCVLRTAGRITAGLAARVAAATCFLRVLDGLADGFLSLMVVVVNVVCFFVFLPLSVSSFASISMEFSGIRATPFALSAGEAASGGFFLLLSSEGAVSVGLF